MGKQHGSLARAGKVRGQTPKRCTGDQPKKLTGRAKKRQLFNKRIHSASALDHHKLSINSQSRPQNK